jgi:hypothetical protein
VQRVVAEDAAVGRRHVRVRVAGVLVAARDAGDRLELVRQEVRVEVAVVQVDEAEDRVAHQEPDRHRAAVRDLAGDELAADLRLELPLQKRFSGRAP